MKTDLTESAESSPINLTPTNQTNSEPDKNVETKMQENDEIRVDEVKASKIEKNNDNITSVGSPTKKLNTETTG